MKLRFFLMILTFLVMACNKKVSTAPGPENIGTVTVNAINSDKARILLAMYNVTNTTGNVTILDGNGETVREKYIEDIALDFKKWSIEGKTRYTYLVRDKSYSIPGFTSTVLGYQVIADEDLNEIKRVYLQAHGSISTSEQRMVDVHDFILLSDNHYISMAYYLKKVNNIPASLNPAKEGVNVIAPIIQEVYNGRVIWQWDGTEHNELYAASVEGNNFGDNTTPQDYLHLNSMTVDPTDENLICSFRNANLILKIDRNTGNILWRLGGNISDYYLRNDQKFLRQHHVTLTDNNKTLLIFDNGEATERPYTRILEMQLDQLSKTILDYKAFKVPQDFSRYMGSVQKFDSTYFIGGGSSPYIMEVNYLTSEIVFEMILPDYTYRAFKYKD